MVSVIFAKYTNERLPQFRIATQIIEEDAGLKKIIKKPLTELSTNHVFAIWDNYNLLQKNFPDMKYCEAHKLADWVEFAWVSGISLEKRILQMAEEQLFDSIMQEIKLYNNYISAQSKGNRCVFVASSSFKNVFGDFEYREPVDIVACANIDATFDNILIDEDGSYINVDYEWVFNFAVPSKYIIWRSLWYLFKRKADLFADIRFENILKCCDIDDVLDEKFHCMEMSFQNYVVGEKDSCCYYGLPQHVTHFENIYFEKKELFRQCEGLNNSIIELQGQVEQQHQFLQEKDRRIGQQQKYIDEKEERIDDINKEILAKDLFIAQKDAELAKLKDEIFAICTSRSWRWTYILRNIADRFKR